ncbi:Putative pleckstrin domain, PH-like domain superfamily, Ubiquitin-like domain superfamily [Septoria linicola]|uniref:Pleckstrin domain, PH-like domain superfamily, Ubiquitin-like domain superfamily n=1 Tax=Septoria linicola TaxID=215465 RepID=A0A9Q9EJB2_9PEZI|nr:putative pleckstrin domain, PH-like domain superfamily, Ubiquitin-like domain superfamily [Septoria linicola]USW51168.1 Putative pleckstrin domain, PH-like domain superfamily, Ubiquitin-like domain superfamily [Septoria linicola]
MADASSPPSQPPSRYRSQRQKHAPLEEEHNQQQQHSSPGAVVSAADGDVARSKSRYHRKPNAAPASPPETRPASQEQHSEAPARYHSKHRTSPLKPLYQEQVVQAPRLQPTRTISSENHSHARHAATPPAGLGAQDPRHFSSSDERDSDAERRQQSRDRPSKSRHNDHPLPAAAGPPTLPLPASPPPPSGEVYPRPMEVAEPVRRDGPPQSGQIKATPSMSELPQLNDETRGCFGGLFKRKRGDAAAATVDKDMIARPATAKHNEPIRPGGGGVVPGIDAPKSAVNAGDRKVLVECQKSQRWFSVTPETTSVDIIKAAATVMTEHIDIKSALLVETFKSVGVQRPLRRYEQIRDVMNSWDDDAQNRLVLVDPGAGTIEPELTITGAPKDRPEGDTWVLTSSYRPGKWEKRYVTLKPDGQIVQQKDMDKPKDASNVCHLSDFDIYTPTAERKKGKIKPPKKHCFAIKSQQKTTMFESTEDYVHFFCTADPVTSDSFYRAVQSYRSWYLVNVRGVGKKEKPKPVMASAPLQPQEAGGMTDRKASTEQAKTHRPHESMESHYQLGSFKPLIDMDQFEKRPSSSGSGSGRAGSGGFTKSADQFNTNAPLEKRSNTVKRSHPPGTMSNKGVLAEDEPLANLGRSTSVNKRRSSTDQTRLDSSEFKDTGLLGRKYSQRRKENERESAQNAFSPGPNLLNGGLAAREDYFGAGDGLQRKSSTRKHNSNSDMKRSSSTREPNRNGGHRREGSVELDRSRSQRQKPKPLIDLTPEYKEPPQHKNKGRGHRPDRLGAGGLIESATTPEDPLNIPQGTVFRNASGGQYNANMIPPGPHSPGLIDLTPQHKEPVHHARKGRGYVTENGHAGGLVHNASTPEDPLNIPQSNIFRSVNAMPEGRVPSGHSTQQAQAPSQRRLSFSKSPDAFTGEGLLASAANRQGWGTGDKGRGVIDGSRAGGKPLVDLNYDSQYAKGTLLNKVEKAQGGAIQAPIIDREDGGKF